jgi:hypothetical protein
MEEEDEAINSVAIRIQAMAYLGILPPPSGRRRIDRLAYDI